MKWVKILAWWSVGLVVATVGGVSMAQTDIADAPLVSSSASEVKPNLMFVIDDSGSMAFDWLPDHVANDVGQCRRWNGGSPDYAGKCCFASPSSDALPGNSLPQTCFRGGDWRGQPPFMSPDFNGVYYNPAITYTPPLRANGTSYPSQTSANTSGWTNVKSDAYGVQSTATTNLLTEFPDVRWCTNAWATNCLRNGNYLLPGRVGGNDYGTYVASYSTGTGSVAVGTPDNPTTETRSFGPYYYAMNPVEWCDGTNLRRCQATQSATYSHAAKVRWCDSRANAKLLTPPANTCQGLRTPTYQYARYATIIYGAGTPAVPAVAAKPASVTFSISISGTCSNTSSQRVNLNAVSVVGYGNLISGTTSNAWAADGIAAAIRSSINSRSGTTGYVATNSGASLTITAPTSAGSTPGAVSITKSNTSSCNAVLNPAVPTFSGYAPAVAAVPAGPGTSPGSLTRVDIVPGTTQYPKASTRTDCGGAGVTTCSYAQEMTNFANWWTYYHTRMQSMKSSTSLAFETITDNFRVGYLSINNATGGDFLNVGTFSDTHKTQWFSKLTAAKPYGATPLRTALATVGRMYAGRLNGSSLNGSTVVEPTQFSCQQNFTILSTDGYWNGDASTPRGVDGNAVGDRDSGLPRPLRDGSATANTLADVAAYYYDTDLRTDCSTGPDLCENNVKTSDVDVARHQHMTTFTLGLGVSGAMQFNPDYGNLDLKSGDYYAVKNGLAADPSNGICAWQTGGTCEWPLVAENTPTTVDDLWHAAVNGRGTYFSAVDPNALYRGLSTTLGRIKVRLGSVAAATASNPNPVEGDNFLFATSFESGDWTGNVTRRDIDVATGKLEGVEWEARDLLTSVGSRNLVTFAPGATSRLKSFTWESLTASEKAYFGEAHIKAAGRALSQFCTVLETCLSAENQTAAAGQRLFDYLRGVRVDEGPITNLNKFFRERKYLLGDIVSSEPAYVGGPKYRYADTGYAGFAASNKGRQGMVYVGANDGMLHAFDATSGQEAWAYVPSMVLPNLYLLADKDYTNRHRYFVDGPVATGDVRIAGEWRTILVGGLGAGGRGYFALDVTDPANPSALWEFTADTSKGAGFVADEDLGLSMGKAQITKLKDGTWVVIVASGHNNISPGTGRGFLFVLDAATGQILQKIATGVGSTTTPAGLTHVAAWADSAEVDNTTQRVYAGDNLGNVWRFDINGDIGAEGHDAQLLAQLRGSAGNIQPVTARPEIGLVNNLYAMVYVGTGRFLGASDMGDNQPQSIYAIKDNLTAVGYGVVRGNSGFIAQTLTPSLCPANATVCSPSESVRIGSKNTVNLATDNGWYIDLPAGEKAYTDPVLTLGMLIVTTNIPEASACTAGGSSYLNYFDYRNGAPLNTASGVAGVFLGNFLSSAVAAYGITSPGNGNGNGNGNGGPAAGTTSVRGSVQNSEGQTVDKALPTRPGGTVARRLSWRELPTEQ